MWAKKRNRLKRLREKVYLEKLEYLRNFLNLYRCYKVYLKFGKSRKSVAKIGWIEKFPIEWEPKIEKSVRRQWKFSLHRKFYDSKVATVVIFYYFNCQIVVENNWLDKFNLIGIQFVLSPACDKRIFVFYILQNIKNCFLILTKFDGAAECDCDSCLSEFFDLLRESGG